MRLTTLLLCGMLVSASIACVCGPLAGHASEDKTGHANGQFTAVGAYEAPAHHGSRHHPRAGHPDAGHPDAGHPDAGHPDVGHSGPGHSNEGHPAQHASTEPCVHLDCGTDCGLPALSPRPAASDPVTPDGPLLAALPALQQLTFNPAAGERYRPPWRIPTNPTHTPVSRHDKLLM